MEEPYLDIEGQTYLDNTKHRTAFKQVFTVIL